MSTQREEMLDLRKAFYERLGRMRHIGDYGAGAADIRETAEAVMKLIDHALERMK